MTEIVGAFVLGILGSAHCVGMCGAFAVGIGGLAGRTGRRTSMLGAYFLGKTLTYVVLGALAGALGSVFGAYLGRFQSSLSIGIGVLLILTGIGLLGYGRWRLLRAPFFSALPELAGRLMRRRRAIDILAVGMLNGLIPCGLVYGAVLLAAASGSIVLGGAVMAAFGLATVPALALVGLSSGWLARSRVGAILPRLAAALIIVMGVLTVVRGTPLRAWMHGGHDQPAIEQAGEAPSHHLHAR